MTMGMNDSVDSTAHNQPPVGVSPSPPHWFTLTYKGHRSCLLARHAQRALSLPVAGTPLTPKLPVNWLLNPCTHSCYRHTHTHRLPRSPSSGKAILAMPGVHSPIWVKSGNKCVCSPQPPAGHSLFIEVLRCDGSLQLVPVPQVCACGNKHVQTRTNTKALRHTETKSKFLLELAVGGQG